VTDVPFVTRAIDQELAIVHVPFTGLQRFARKVDAIREIVRQHGDQSDSEVAWHWRSWATLDDAGVCAEFERQILEADSEQTVTTASTLFQSMGEPTPPADPYSFGTLNTMVRYVDVIKPRAIPEWIDIPFDEHWYLEQNEDLRQSVENGTLDARAHFLTVGIVEGRSPSRAVDPHFLRRELERYSKCYLELRDVYWLYFSLPAAQRPMTAAR
jgi:hypothetical protein